MNTMITDSFSYLKRKNGQPFEADIVRQWYLARAFALRLLDNVAYRSTDRRHLHVFLDADSDEMLYIARHVALLAHYINFCDGSEETPVANRTVISINSRRSEILTLLAQEHLLGNLPLYCKVQTLEGEVLRPDSHLDIELHIVDGEPEAESDADLIVVKSGEAARFFGEADPDDDTIFKIDNTAARLASRVYDLGAYIGNLPAEDIHCVKRYTQALNVFKYHLLKSELKPMLGTEEDRSRSACSLKESVSNIFCADCFASRMRSIRLSGKNGVATTELWEANNLPLSKSEHARWETDRLIMGYRPLTIAERQQLELLRVQTANTAILKQYKNKLKGCDADPAHYDICSYRELRRTNPDDMKYDSFLMQAIPHILSHISTL